MRAATTYDSKNSARAAAKEVADELSGDWQIVLLENQVGVWRWELHNPPLILRRGFTGTYFCVNALSTLNGVDRGIEQCPRKAVRDQARYAREMANELNAAAERAEESAGLRDKEGQG
jgi:hypothetical protein